MQRLLEWLERHPDARVREIARFAPDETRQLLEEAGPLGWLPVEYIVGIDDLILEHLGRTRTLEAWRDFSIAQSDLPLFTPVVNGVARVFGKSPVPMLTKASQRVFALAQRDCADLVLVDHAPEARLTLRYENLAPACRTEGYALGATGMPETALHIAGAKGGTKVDTTHLAEGLIVVEATWSTRR